MNFVWDSVWPEQWTLHRRTVSIERRTSNAQHRTLNIDDATLYRFYNKRTVEYWTAACDELSRVEFRRVNCFAQAFFNWQYTLFDVGRSMFDVRRSFFINHLILNYITKVSISIWPATFFGRRLGWNLTPYVPYNILSEKIRVRPKSTDGGEPDA